MIDGNDDNSLTMLAAIELESMKRRSEQGLELQPFPPTCMEVVKLLPGNNKCIDCGDDNPNWAAVTYGALLCLRCCGRHRGFGLEVRFKCRLGVLTISYSACTVFEDAIIDNGPLVIQASVDHDGRGE